MLNWLNSTVLQMIREIGGITLFVGQIMKTLFHTRGNFSRILGQLYSITIRSLSTVAFSGVFVGAILVIQFNLILQEYDAATLLGGLNTSALVREVGPLIISFILAGKIGAYTAAELGTMRVTEQMDAVECLGTDPLQYLILPRFLGIVLSGLLLLAIGLIISIFGSMFIADIFCGINPLQYVSSIPYFADSSTVASGLFKSFVYANIVAAVSCYKGYTAKGGAKGVGQSVNQAAIYTNFYIVIATYVTTKIWEIGQSLAQSFSGGV